MSSSRRFPLAPLAFAVGFGFSLPLLAGDQDAVTQVSLQAQPLGSALNQLAREAHLQLLVEPALVAGKSAPAVSGRLTASQALARALDGSGLEATIQGDTVVIRAAAAGRGADSGALQLQSTSITGAGDSTEGYRAYSTGTASKMDTPMLEEAQVVNVITPQLLDDYQIQSLDEIGKFASGIVQSNTYGNTEDGLIKRGFGTNTDGSVLRDGARSANQHNLSATTERIEVLKGPASLLYGVLEPGGVVNILSKRPLYVSRNEIEAESSSFGGGSLMLDTAGPLGDSGFAFRLIAERQHEDYWRNFGTYEHKLVAPSLSWKSDRASLVLAYERNDYSQPFDRGTVFINGKPARTDYAKRFDETWAKSEGENENFTARFEYSLNDDWSTRLTYNWSSSLYDDSMARPVGLRPAPATPGTWRRRNDGNRDVHEVIRYASWDWIGHTELLGMKHDLLLGLDSERNDENRGDSLRGPVNDAFNIYDPVYGNLPAPSKVDAATSNFTSEIHSQSAYFKDNWHLDEQWILALGGRFQHFDHYYGIGRPFKVGTDTQDDVFLPFLGLVYQLNEQMSLYANYSRSFVPNRADSDTGATFDPEEGRSYEAGIKVDAFAGVGLSLAVFDIEKKNVVVSETDSETGLSVSKAAGKVRSRGVELDMNARLGERWDLLGSYAYTDTRVLEDPTDKGNRLDNAPRNAASLYLSHRLALPAEFGEWHLGGGARYVGARAGDSANSFYLDSYTLADAFVRWDSRLMGQKTRLQLNVNNLFDKEYYPSSAGAIRVNVGEPREVRMTASVEF